MEWIILIAFVAALAGLARHIQTRLPAHVRASIKQLRSDIQAIDESLEVCRHNLATATTDHGLMYYPREIATLEARRAEKVQQIQTHKTVARQPKPRRLPAPPLNPRWDKTSPSCYHEEIEPVYTESAGDAPVAWICVKCLDSLDENSPEAKNWTAQQKRKFARAKADAEWRAIWSSPSDQEAAREESHLKRADAIVKAAHDGLLSVESAKELLNNEDEDEDDVTLGSNFVAGSLTGDRIEVNAWGSAEPVRTYDKGGLLPPGTAYLKIMPNFGPIMTAEMWEKIPGWTEGDTDRARQLIQPPTIDASSSRWYQNVNEAGEIDDELKQIPRISNPQSYREEI